MISSIQAQNGKFLLFIIVIQYMDTLQILEGNYARWIYTRTVVVFMAFYNHNITHIKFPCNDYIYFNFHCKRKLYAMHLEWWYTLLIDIKHHPKESVHNVNNKTECIDNTMTTVSTSNKSPNFIPKSKPLQWAPMVMQMTILRRCYTAKIYLISLKKHVPITANNYRL